MLQDGEIPSRAESCFLRKWGDPEQTQQLSRVIWLGRSRADFIFADLAHSKAHEPGTSL